MQSIKNEIDRVNLEIQSAERDYDLNRAAELKYGTVLQLQKQLKQAEEALEKEAVSHITFKPSKEMPSPDSPGGIFGISGCWEYSSGCS